MDAFLEDLDEYESTDELEELKSYYEQCLDALNDLYCNISLPYGSQADQSLDTINEMIDNLKDKIEEDLNEVNDLIDSVEEHLEDKEKEEEEKEEKEREDEEFLDWLVRSRR